MRNQHRPKTVAESSSEPKATKLLEAKGNWAEWTRACAVDLIKEFGAVAKFFEDGPRYVIPPVTLEDYEPAVIVG